MSRRTPPESIAWLHHAAAAGQADARLMLQMLERLEALEAAQREAAMDELRKASSELQSTPEAAPAADDDEPQTLHTIALKMVDTLEQLRVLPEILDTLRRAIREPMQQTTPEAAPVATDEELRALSSMEVWTVDARRALYNLGREHGARAAAQLAPPAAPAPTGGLVELMALAIGGDGDHPANWTPEARRAIREVAAWMRQGRMLNAAELLEQEADR